MAATVRSSLLVAGVAGSLFTAATALAQPAPPTPAVEPAGAPTPVPPALEPAPAVEPAPAAEEPAPAVTVEPAPAAAPAVDPALIATLVDAELKERDTVSWKDGFTLRSGDGAFELKIGGYTHFDSRFFVGDDDERLADQFTFRRIRPELRGTLFGRAEFRLLPDFAGGRAVVQDAYVDLTITPGGELKLRAGKFKEPFGIERLQSATAITFVERALPTQLAPNRDLGLQLFGEVAQKRVGYQLGVFNGVADGGSGDGDVSDDKEVAARLFVTPFAPDKGSLLEQLGVGAAVTYGEKLGTLAATDLPSLRTSGQAAFFSYRTGETIDMTTIADGTHYRASAQGHWYAGPAGVLLEYVRSSQEVSIGEVSETVVSDAWQVALSGVIGGKATFRSVTIDEPFAPGEGHWGAVELAARYHELRIDDAAFEAVADPARSAERARSVGGGVSWHLSKALKAVLDYESTTFQGGAADGADRATEHAVLGRVQTVF